VNLPQLQVLNVEELLNDVEFILPPSSSGASKKAGKVKKGQEQQGFFD
jgi:hypothetical protein